MSSILCTNLKKGSFLFFLEIVFQDVPKPYNHLMFIMVATIVTSVLSNNDHIKLHNVDELQVCILTHTSDHQHPDQHGHLI